MNWDHLNTSSKIEDESPLGRSSDGDIKESIMFIQHKTDRLLIDEDSFILAERRNKETEMVDSFDSTMIDEANKKDAPNTEREKTTS